MIETAAPTTLKEHIAAEDAEIRASVAAPVVEEKKPAEQPAKVEESAAETLTPEQEADSHKPDAELSEAAKTLRKGRADKRAERVKGENDELARELQRRKELRSELERFAPAPPAPAERTPSAGTAAAPTAGDPNFPEPREEDYQDYGKYLIEHARWAARDELRKEQIASRERIERATHKRTVSEQASTLDTLHAKGREKWADFDAVIDTILAGLRDNPRAPAVSEFLASSKAGEDLAYRLGKDTDALKTVTTASSVAEVFRALATVEHSVLVPKQAPKHTTNAPAPPSKTVSAGASAATVDTTKPGTSTKDHIRVEEAEIAERRKAGYRY